MFTNFGVDTQLNSENKKTNDDQDTVSESEEYKNLMKKYSKVQKKSTHKIIKPKKQNKQKYLKPQKCGNKGLKKVQMKQKSLKSQIFKTPINSKHSKTSILKPRTSSKCSQLSTTLNKTPISHKLEKELESLRECSFTPNLK